MDINNNQLVNSFTGGMNTDTSDALLKNDQYRYAENLRLHTSINSNTGELHLVEGTIPVKTQDLRWELIVAITSVRDKLIVVGTRRRKGNGAVPIEYNVFIRDGVDWRAVLDNSSWLPYEAGSAMLLVGRYESDKNIKLYIADGKNEIAVLRIDKYNQKLLRANGARDYAYEFIPPAEIVEVLEGGALEPAKVLYTYELYGDGEASQLAPVSKVATLYDTSDRGYTDENGVITNKSVHIKLPDPSIWKPLCKKCKIYRVTYIQNGQLPSVQLIYNESRVVDYIDSGGGKDVDLSEEYLEAIKNNMHIRPKEIEAKNDILFAANITYSIDDLDAKLAKVGIECTAPSTEPYGDELFNGYKWDPDKWMMPGGFGPGGKGKYFLWEFIYDDIVVHEDNSIEDDKPNNTLHRGEVYRYAIILYDNNGVASTPKWMADILVPLDSDKREYSTVIFNGESNRVYTMRRLGIKITLIEDFPPLLVDPVTNKPTNWVVGWQVVRCQRKYSDRINLSEGIIGLPLIFKKVAESTERGTIDRGGSDKLEYIFPNGLMTMQWMYNLIGNKYILQTTSNYAMFASPDYCYDSENFDSLVSNYKRAIEIRMKNVYAANVKNTSYSDSNPWYEIDNDNTTEPTQHNYYSYGYTGPGNIGNEKSDNQTGGELKGTRSGSFDGWRGEGSGPSLINVNKNALVRRLLRYEAFSGDAITNPSKYYTHDFYNVYARYEVGFDAESLTPGEITKVDHYTFVKAPEWNSFSSDGVPNLENSIAIIGNDKSKSFVNWMVHPVLISTDLNDLLTQTMYQNLMKGTTETLTDLIHVAAADDGNGYLPFASTGGTCMLLYSEEQEGFGYYFPHDRDISRKEATLPIFIANLRRSAPVPYGGPNEMSKLNSTYYGHGYIVQCDDLYVMGAGSFDKYADVYDGDAYLGVFTYNVAHFFDDRTFTYADKLTSIYNVPIESNINLRATYGDLYPRMSLKSIYVQDLKASIDTVSYMLTKDAYKYNFAYSAELNVIDYAAIYYSSIASFTYDTRVHYSNTKINGEDRDSWLQMTTERYIDVDNRYGAITNLKVFKDKLYFWQEHAFGVFTINEKYVVADLNNGGNLILGNNQGVALRYDYISTTYGMKKDQHCDAQSDNALYWWDEDNEELLLFSGSGVVPLISTHFILNYINTSQTQPRPNVSYDAKYDEVLASVRIRNGVELTLVYKEKANVFTSVYTFGPKFSEPVAGELYLTSYDKVYKTGYSSAAFLFNLKAYPLLQYIVNDNAQHVKTFDILTINGVFHGVFNQGLILSNVMNTLTSNLDTTSPSNLILFKYNTPLNQVGYANQQNVLEREGDYRLNVPREHGKNDGWGYRLRGKTMKCEISSRLNSTNFSLLYITTKYRMSWS